MRVVAGRFKGKSLAAPKGLNTRPTTDRVREALFNVLTHGEPQINFEDGLGKVHKWFLENWDNIKRDAEF